jgi:hypothetical protein
MSRPKTAKRPTSTGPGWWPTSGIRPENLAAEKFSYTAPGKLKAALDALERQVRETRDRLRERRQRS